MHYRFIHYRLMFLYFILLFSNLVFSQTGPGGVGSSVNNELWLIPDNNTYIDSGTTLSSNNDPILQWNDVSGNLNHAIQNTSSRRPLYRMNDLNGYSTIRFDGSDDRILASGIQGTSSQLTVFVLLKFNSFLNTNNGIFSAVPSGLAFTTNPWRKSVSMFANTTNATSGRIYGRGVQSDFTARNLPAVTTLNAGNYHIITQDYNGTAIEQYVDASFSSTVTYNNTLASWVEFGIGQQGFENTDADIAEIIVFREHLNTSKRIIIENYLAAKYDQGLTSNDLYTQDNAGNGNFDHDVAGIGQATDGSNHTDARGTGIVRISSPSALSNGDYLFWGEETKDPNYAFISDNTNYTEQLNSKWRVSKVNDLGTVTVAFDITGMDISAKLSCQPLQLVVDNDSDFTSPTVYDLTIAGTTATATGVSFADGDYFTLRFLDQIVWDGTRFFNGSGTANAPDNTNECLKFTVKSGLAGTLTFDAHVREVEVESGGTITVADGILLEVENQVDVNGVIDLLGEAQLIQNHTSTTSNSGTGELRVRQQGTTNLYNYNYWSAPVNRSGAWQIGYLEDANGVVNFTSAWDANPTTSPITLSSRWLYDFNAVSGEYAGWNSLSITSNITPGRGFTTKGSGAIAAEQEYLFKGIPNDGDYSYTVNGGNDFLTGNPYPSALDADQFINDNLAIIDGTLYFWEHFSSNNSHALADYEGGYATYNLMMSLPAVADDSGLTSGIGTASRPNPTNRIPVGQGFFVTIENSGNLVFNNGQRKFARESLDESIFYRTSETTETTSNTDSRPKIWFSFIDPDAHHRVIGLGYDINATYDYDNGYDAKAYEDQLNEICWKLNDDKLHIQALPAINTEDELPLELKITTEGTYTFSINEMQNFPDDINIYLKDKNQDVYHDLREGDTSLSLSSGLYTDTYSIVFNQTNVLSIDDPSVNNNTYILYHTDTEQLELLQKKALDTYTKYSVYSLPGQKLYDTALNNNLIDISKLSQGIYILKLYTTENNNSFSTKFVKY